jgi:hypothetical protein
MPNVLAGIAMFRQPLFCVCMQFHTGENLQQTVRRPAANRGQQVYGRAQATTALCGFYFRGIPGLELL